MVSDANPSKMHLLSHLFSITFLCCTLVRATNIVLANDDGWAELNIRTFFNTLTASPFNYDVVLSAPAENESGTGSSDATPTVLNTTCEFDTCPVGSPAEGFNASNRKSYSDKHTN